MQLGRRGFIGGLIAAVFGWFTGRISETPNIDAVGPSVGLVPAGHITEETAARIRALWDEEFCGDNIGKVAMLTDDLTYEVVPMSCSVVQGPEWSDEDLLEGVRVVLPRLKA